MSDQLTEPGAATGPSTPCSAPPDKFQLPKKLHPFATRLRIHLKHLGLTDPVSAQRLEDAKRDMRLILKKKNVTGTAAERAIDHALDAAADYQIQTLRSHERDRERTRRLKAVHELVGTIARISAAIERLPPTAKGKLNQVAASTNWADFDMEVFQQFVDELLQTLSALSPRRLADDVVVEIQMPHNRNDPMATRPALIELWDTIHGVMRAKVESELRKWTPPTRGPVLAVLAYINDLFDDLLEEHRLRASHGRRRALINSYMRKIAVIGRWCNLKGRSYDAIASRQSPSPFQAFARKALGAVGDDSVVSARQIENLKVPTRRAQTAKSHLTSCEPSLS
jgi:hypothetical protein